MPTLLNIWESTYHEISDGTSILITFLTAKANSTLGFVQCNIKISNPRVKECAYKTLVRPILEYSLTVWDPHTSGAVSKIESDQRRAAWYTLNIPEDK